MSNDNSPLFQDPTAAIRYALLLGNDDAREGLEFLQSWLDRDLEALGEWDFDGTRECVPERS